MLQTVQIRRQVVAVQLQHDGIGLANDMYVSAIDDKVGRLKVMVQLQQHAIGHWFSQYEFINSDMSAGSQPLPTGLAQSQAVGVKWIVPDLSKVIVIGVRYF